MLIYFDGNDLLIGIGILCVLLPVLWWRKRSQSYLIFVSIFWAYLLAVVAVIVFPVAINTQYSAGSFMPDINLVPFYFGDCFMLPDVCMRSIIKNILLAIPFGFGVNFLARVKPKNIPWLALAVGFVFEFLQLVISLSFRSSFRAIDINDFMLNGTGVLVGYALFRIFAALYLNMTEYFNFRHRFILADIYAVALQTQAAGRSKKAQASLKGGS